MHRDKVDKYLASTLVDSFFHKFIDTRIVLWGLGLVSIKILRYSKALRHALVKVVDINHSNMTEYEICGLSVDNPATLEGIHFDYVLIGAPKHARSQIVQSLKAYGHHDPKIIDFL